MASGGITVETDPVFSASPAASITEEKKAEWDNKGTVTGVKINGSTKNPSNGIVDLGTVLTAHQDISGKQDKLVSGTNIKTINGQSILGSGNITIEGGSGAYGLVNHGTSDTEFALTPNTLHVWDEVASLTLTLGSGQSGVANEYVFQFTSGATATSLTLPDDIKWANDSPPTISTDKIYQISILNGLASVLEFSNAVALIDNLCELDGQTIYFRYPTASTLEVGVGMAKITVPAGARSYNIDELLDFDAEIRYINPATDHIYHYIF